MSVKVNKTRSLAMAAALVGASTMAVMTTGCERPDWDDPDYVIQQLEEGSTVNQRQAVEQLRHMPEDRRDDAAAAAAQAYLQEEDLRSDVMRRLIEWRHPNAIDAYLEEMEHDHTGYGDSSARVLGEIGDDSVVPKMLEVFDETGDHDRRIGILEGLSHMPDAEVVERAVSIFEMDPDNYPIALHRAACEFIGGLGLEDPESIDDEAMNRLIYARFLSNEQGQDTAQACGLAIQQVGPQIVPHLIELFNGEHEDVQTLLMTYDNPGDGEHFPENRSKHRAAQHLSQLHAAEAVELFMDALQEDVESPDWSGDRLGAWNATQMQALNQMYLGLGDIGDPEARELVESIMRAEPFADEWSDVADGPGIFQTQQDAARALARLGDRDAREALMDQTGADIVGPMAQRFAALEEHEDHDAPPLVEQLRPQWLAAQSFAYLGQADDREAYDELISDVEGLEDDDLTERLESFAVAFDVMDECEELEGQEQAQCFGGFLDDDDEHARAKAAMELSRMEADAAGSVIMEHLDTSRLGTRELLTFAAYRSPGEGLADRVQEVIEGDANRSSSSYEADRRRLRMLHAWAVHHERGSGE